MANCTDGSTEGNLFDNNMVFFLLATIFLFGGTWMDVFILTVNLRDWMKKKHLNTTDKILTLQGGIRICLGCTMMTWSTLVKICPSIVWSGHIFRGFKFSFWYFTSCNFWLTASLCSYYCVKIADFSHPFFIHLKLRLPGLESAWLLGSAVLSLASSLPFAYSDLGIRGHRIIPDFFQNKTVADFFQNKNVTDISHTTIVLSMYVLLGSFAAFSICATSAALLLFSLWRHRQRMLGNWGGHRSPQTDAHLQAVITIFSLLINSVIVFISILLVVSRGSGRNVISVVATVVIYSCFSVESVISIWGNKKLKNELCRFLHFAKCRGCVR